MMREPTRPVSIDSFFIRRYRAIHIASSCYQLQNLARIRCLERLLSRQVVHPVGKGAPSFSFFAQWETLQLLKVGSQLTFHLSISAYLSIHTST